jgi:hypothetical protein
VAAPGHNRGVGDVVASSRVGCTPATVPGPRLAAGGNIWRRMSPIPILATEVRIQLAEPGHRTLPGTGPAAGASPCPLFPRAVTPRRDVREGHNAKACLRCSFRVPGAVVDGRRARPGVMGDPTTVNQPCPFCQLLESDAAGLRIPGDAAFPDAFPVSPGHTLVVPDRHGGGARRGSLVRTARRGEGLG